MEMTLESGPAEHSQEPESMMPFRGDIRSWFGVNSATFEDTQHGQSWVNARTGNRIESPTL
jgi:hypothetical protein